MRTSLLAMLLLALAFEQAAAWKFHHGHHHHHHAHAVCGAGWDRYFKIVGPNFIDPAPGQFAQKAFNTVLVQTSAAAINKGLLPKGSKWVSWKLHAGCYKSVVPGSLGSAQHKGVYQFHYEVAYKVPKTKHLVWKTVVADSWNRRHFPWFEIIEAYFW